MELNKLGMNKWMERSLVIFKRKCHVLLLVKSRRKAAGQTGDRATEKQLCRAPRW